MKDEGKKAFTEDTGISGKNLEIFFSENKSIPKTKAVNLDEGYKYSMEEERSFVKIVDGNEVTVEYNDEIINNLKEKLRTRDAEIKELKKIIDMQNEKINELLTVVDPNELNKKVETALEIVNVLSNLNYGVGNKEDKYLEKKIESNRIREEQNKNMKLMNIIEELIEKINEQKNVKK